MIVSGESTGDKVSLLDVSEYIQYRDIIESHICSHTAYASKKGIRIGRAYCWWGLKTQLTNKKYAYVCETIMYYRGDNEGSYDDIIGIRPTIWIDLLNAQ